MTDQKVCYQCGEYERECRCPLPPYALRDLFALAAMHALLTRALSVPDEDLARGSYIVADAMLAERERKA